MVLTFCHKHGPFGYRFCGGLLTLTATLLSTALFLLLFKNSSRVLFDVGVLNSVSPTDSCGRHPGTKATKSLGIPEDLKEITLPWLFNKLQANGSRECHNEHTTRAHLFGLPWPSSESPIRLTTDRVHELLLLSYTENGTRRCSGGDFYETDITGAHWKARPPVLDMGDGSYLVKLQVERRFAGIYSFTATLLFTNYHGLEHQTTAWKEGKSLISLQIMFWSDNQTLSRSNLKMCTKNDFKLKSWSGRWSQSKGNASCKVNHQGRYLCLDLEEKCEAPWCEGPLGILESNGWVYSAHCGFKLYNNEEAWKCLEGRWIFSWGDSNHQDTLKNLLYYVLGCPDADIPRIFHKVYYNPRNVSQNVTITQLFNGHYDIGGNNLGLASLGNGQYRQMLTSLFYNDTSNYTVRPDAILMNSGLHDGLYNWPAMSNFSDAAESAAEFWESVLTMSPNKKRPAMMYRTTVAPAGFVRGSPSNPQKMEAYNLVMVEAFSKKFPEIRIVDSYDMTFPYHYDNNYSDGGHYGRPGNGRHYFVDFMLVHILLNALCPFTY